MPWCMCGDFNIIRFTSEHSGDPLSMAMEDLSNFLLELKLLDLPLVRGAFTWSYS